MNAPENNNKLPSTRTCPCCGSSLNDRDSLKGPYENSPYRMVCHKCWVKPFLHFPDKIVGKDGLSYPETNGENGSARLRIWKGELEKRRMHVLLVEPNYYTRYPPLGLLRLSSFHRVRGDYVRLVRFPERPKIKPDIIYVTSLFTYSWRKVHEAVGYYKSLFPKTQLVLGGIYASLLPDHAMLSGADWVHIGLVRELENLKPDYSIIRRWNWDSNIIFSSRGCIRRCGFCAVPKLEKEISSRKTILKTIDRRLKKVVLWDNNVLATSNWQSIFKELEELGYEVDFNQGFDAKLITPEAAEAISHLKTRMIRLAFDDSRNREALSHAITLLYKAGIQKRKILVYTLYNYRDTPSDFLSRMKQLLQYGVVSYPMRYEPLCVLTKNMFVSPNWNGRLLNLVQQARRVIGYSGAFPPYAPLVRKITKAKTLDIAFGLRPSLEEIKLKLMKISEKDAELVYAYFKKHDLTARQVPLNDALIRSKRERRTLHVFLKKRNPQRPQRRLGGSLDWRHASNNE